MIKIDRFLPFLGLSYRDPYRKQLGKCQVWVVAWGEVLIQDSLILVSLEATLGYLEMCCNTCALHPLSHAIGMSMRLKPVMRETCMRKMF